LDTIGWCVDVDPAREVAALDEEHIVGREVVAGAAVTGRVRRHTGPVLTAEDDGMAGSSLVCGPAEAARVVTDRRDHALDDVAPHIGQVDERDDRGAGVGVLDSLKAAAKRGTHALCPVTGLHPAHRRSGRVMLGEEGHGLVGLGTEDDDDG
jgi:hypothetical protein